MAGNRLIFDVGAFRGDKTAEYLEADARVVAFEPNPDYAQRLRTRFGDKVTIIEKALGETEGVVKLMICSKVPSISTCNENWTKGRFQRYKWDRQIDVEQTTLDAAISQYGLPVFIKIDVEGYEYEVLKGLHTCVPELSFEFANEFQGTILKCVVLLLLQGYQEFALKVAKARDFVVPYLPHNAVLNFLERQPQTLWGDIYAR